MADQTVDDPRLAMICAIFNELEESNDKNSVLCAVLLDQLKNLEAKNDGCTSLAYRLCQVLDDRLSDTSELEACRREAFKIVGV